MGEWGCRGGILVGIVEWAGDVFAYCVRIINNPVLRCPIGDSLKGIISEQDIYGPMVIEWNKAEILGNVFENEDLFEEYENVNRWIKSYLYLIKS